MENQDDLITELKNIIVNNDLTNVIENAFGTKYVVKGLIITSKKTFQEITTVWFIEKGETIPYFITAYPG